jgi:putative transcriptional regulator
MKPEKRKTKRATRRDLFGELAEGMTALAEAREGKRTLRTHHVEFKPPPELSANDLVRVRKRLRLSRALFANFLRTKSRTLENWDRGEPGERASAPSDQPGKQVSRYGGAACQGLMPDWRPGRRRPRRHPPPSQNAPGLCAAASPASHWWPETGGFERAQRARASWGH